MMVMAVVMVVPGFWGEDLSVSMASRRPRRARVERAQYENRVSTSPHLSPVKLSRGVVE